MDRIRDKYGDILTSTQNVFKSWIEYFGDLYEYVEDAATVTELVGSSIAVAEFEEISLQEVVWSIRSLKNEKAVRIYMPWDSL